MVQIVVSEKKSHDGDPFVVLFSFSFIFFCIYDSTQWYPRMLSFQNIRIVVYLWLGRNLREKIIWIRGYVLFLFFFFVTVTVIRSRILITELELTIVKD